MDNVETSIVTITVSDNTNTTHVTTTSSHSNNTSIKFDEVGDLASCKVDLDGVIHLDGWIWVTDTKLTMMSVFEKFLSHQDLVQRLMDAKTGIDSRSSIVRNQVWDSTLAQLASLHFAELVFSLSCLNSVNGEATLGIVDKSEVFASLLNADDIHETGWVCWLGSDFSVDLDKTLHNDLLDLTTVQGILKTV